VSPRPAPTSHRPATRVLVACLFVSGATGLVYEVVWLRMLGLVFGHTVYAITATLAAFMGGLGLGSYLFGRSAARWSDPVRVYGALEIGIGVYCALTPALFWLISQAYLGLHATLVTSYTVFSLVQFALVSAVLLVPTALMGATLPVLVQGLVLTDAGIPRTVGALYAVNTFGAVVGVALAGYVLLPEWGNRTVLWAAAVTNVTVGVVAIAYGSRRRARQHRSSVARPGWRPPTVAPANAPRPIDARLVAAALAVSGALSMVYEVAWTRALALVIGSSTYAFSAMLLAFLIGIAAGAAAYSSIRGGRRADLGEFAILQAGIGLAVALVALGFERFPALFLLALEQSQSIGFVQTLQIVMSSLALLVPALLIGATFPCALSVCASAVARAGADTGRLYGLNTLGAIIGATLTGFVLVPAIGVHASIAAGIATNLLLAGALFAASRRLAPSRRWTAASACVVVALAVVPLLPAWNPRVMSSGTAIYAMEYLPDVRERGAASVLGGRDIVFYRDGVSATVAVTRAGEYLSLRVNGKVDASSDPADMPTQLLLGHLPLLLHRDPRDVLVIGLGSGITTGAVARHPVARLDVVEIEPAVVEASRFFIRENRNVLADPRARLIVADARNFLLTATSRYDVITSEPSNPWIGGVASLFSRQFFALARERLRPGGLMVQWVHGYGLVPDDFRMIVATFRSVFPATSVWQVAQGDYLLIGRADPTALDLASIRSRWTSVRGVRDDLERIGLVDWPGVLGYFLLAEADVARLAADNALNTDDWLGLEFSAPRGLLLDTVADNYRMLQRARTSPLPALAANTEAELERADALYAIGLVPFGQRRWSDSLTWFRRAMDRDAAHTPAALKAAEISLYVGHPDEALALARAVLARDPRHPEALAIATRASRTRP
jgi:spermidine synthase